jgi:hypothetical protein
MYNMPETSNSKVHKKYAAFYNNMAADKGAGCSINENLHPEMKYTNVICRQDQKIYENKAKYHTEMGKIEESKDKNNSCPI